jgi:hypothetical protein
MADSSDKRGDNYLYGMKLIVCLLLLTHLNPGHLLSQPGAADSLLKNNLNPDSVYLEVDIPAEHPKGKDARIRFIEKNIDAGIGLKNGAPVGTYKVRIVCVVDQLGKIIAMVPETHEGYGMENEMMRVLKELPPLNPAIKNGIPVKSKIIFPVVFWSGGR